MLFTVQKLVPGVVFEAVLEIVFTERKQTCDCEEADVLLLKPSASSSLHNPDLQFN